MSVIPGTFSLLIGLMHIPGVEFTSHHDQPAATERILMNKRVPCLRTCAILRLDFSVYADRIVRQCMLEVLAPVS